MAHERELEVALEAARLAGERIRAAYSTFTAIPDARIDITTDADREAQEVILQTVLAAFPDDDCLAEEDTPTRRGRPGTGPRLWIIDPIDGTRGFAQKNGEFSVMVAFAVEGDLAVGVVMEPANGRWTFARRGGGCWLRDGDGTARPCRVTATNDLASALLVVSHTKPGQPLPPPARAIGAARVEQTNSAGVKLARVARGEADLYVNHYPNFHDWDIAAGHVLVEEAGGRVTGLRGQAIVYGSPGADQRVGLLATNGALHESALQRIASVVTIG